MSKRRKILLGIALCLLAGMGAVWLLAPTKIIKEPYYQGKRLSEWIPYSQYSGGIIFNTETPEASNAVTQIGTNAIPWLLKGIRYEPQLWRNQARYFLNRLRNPNVIYPDDEKERQWICSTEGFRLLGTNGAPAIPELVRIMNSTENPRSLSRAMWALSCTGTNAIPPLLKALTNSDNQLRANAAWAFGHMAYTGTNVSPALPLLIQYVQDTNDVLASAAGRSLGRLGFAAETVVPLLINNLNRTNERWRIDGAILGLQAYGSKARSAGPALLQISKNTALPYHDIAKSALLEIAPEMLTNSVSR